MPRSTAGRVALGALFLFLWSIAWGVCFILPHPYVLPWLVLSLGCFVRLHLVGGSAEPRARFRAALRLRPLGPAAPLVAGAVLPIMAIAVAGDILHGQWIGELGGLPEELARLAVGPAGWLSVALITLGFAPLVEELAFRGLIQRALVRRWGVWPGILLTSLLFTLAHFDLQGAYSFFTGGIVLGYAVERTRSIWAGVVLHAANNAVILMLYYRFGSLAPLLRMAQETGVYPVIPAAAAAGAASLLYLGWRARPVGGPGHRGRPVEVAPAA